MNKRTIALAMALVFPLVAFADGKKKDPPSLAGKPANSSSSNAKQDESAKKKGTPPGLAKKTELPPGLAKKFGKKRPEAAYVAFEAGKTDRAWLLIDGKWQLEKGFDASLRGEVKASLALPTVKPPVPLPKIDAKLKVVKFD